MAGALHIEQMRQVVQALSRKDYTEVLQHVRLPADFNPEETTIPSEELTTGQWTATKISETMHPFFTDYEALLFNQEARANHNTIITVLGKRHWSVRQVLLDDQGDRLWYLNGEVNLTDEETPEGALVTLLEISAHGL